MIKQVIVIRKDLSMRRGKEIAQGAHAAMAWLSAKISVGWLCQPHLYDMSEEQKSWLKGSFIKVCLQVDSEAALVDVYDRAKAAGLTVHMVTDNGLTEFGGVPTKTCLAIGPHEAEKIDPITAGLKLY